MQFPELFIFEVEARPMPGGDNPVSAGYWLTYRVVAPSQEEATPSSLIDHAVAYFGRGVTLSVGSRRDRVDALVFSGQVGGGQESTTPGR